MKKKIGDRLRKLRLKKQLTVKELAYGIKKDASTVQKWENSLSEPNERSLFDTAKFYGISSADFLFYVYDDSESIDEFKNSPARVGGADTFSFKTLNSASTVAIDMDCESALPTGISKNDFNEIYFTRKENKKSTARSALKAFALTYLKFWIAGAALCVAFNILIIHFGLLSARTENGLGLLQNPTDALVFFIIFPLLFALFFTALDFVKRMVYSAMGISSLYSGFKKLSEKRRKKQ